MATDTLESRAREAAKKAFKAWACNTGNFPEIAGPIITAFAASEVERALEEAEELPVEWPRLDVSYVNAFCDGVQALRKAIRALKEEPAP